MTWQILCAIPFVVGTVCLIVGLLPTSPKVKNRRLLIGLASLGIAFVLALGLIEYADRLGYPVNIIVPDGYTGKMWIVVDKTQGQAPKLVNGVWIFEIPPSGTLLINDDAAFTIGHEEDYYFANGQQINVTNEGYGSSYPNEPVGYWAIIP